ncbi:MAG: SDR family oxidoreductase [Gammaproteobacteria bacterium]|nr:SDR family oxidoreductase [Gammaproteobacteria bacterium]
MKSVLITGSSRGLGLEWVRQYAQQNWRVFATCRNPNKANELHSIAKKYNNVIIYQLDVTNHNETDALAKELSVYAIDILINNAGVYLDKNNSSIGSLDYKSWEETFRVNTLGPIRVSEAFLQHITASEKRLIVTISSHMGSIADIQTTGSYYYRSSKAALNAAMKSLSIELRSKNIGVLLLHPGWVQTDLGGKNATLTTKQSVLSMHDVIEQFSIEKTGKFIRYDGFPMPW